MKKRIAVFTQNQSSAEIGSITERMSSFLAEPVVVLSSSVPHDQGLEFDLMFAISGNLSVLLRLEGLCAGGFMTKAYGRLLVLVPSERYQLIRSVLLPSSFVSDQLEELLEQGMQYLKKDCCGEIVPKYAKNTADSGAVLSKREKEVLSLLVNGLSNKEVAWTLGISTGTLAAHRRNLYRKTRLSSLSQLVIWGLLHGVGV